MWTVLLVEDEVFVRESVRRIVDWHRLGYDVIGEAGNGEEALAFIVQRRPDLVICDILMPKMNGVELLQRVREAGIESRFIMLSCLGDFEYVRQAMELGASNYILKLSMNVQSLVDALVKVEAELQKRKPGGQTAAGEARPREAELSREQDRDAPLLSGPSRPEGETGHKEVDKLIRFMKNNYDRMISLKTLAQEVSMDEKYISALFKKKTGTNVIHYLHQIRVGEAKRRLEQTSLQVSEIGAQVGYENDNYFIKIFKRFTGLTPSAYRARFLSGRG
ncbi:response regulator [Paenibacillus doosanensis]|uniref:response regulator n=1 Tax=Paenibacillus doosanensis TaxID=1229154 RepID=UPI00217F2ABC|nr:helix-turn-helix domain-containing protein [Paenibacillus doosanensis]MCS7462410.1 response regulator [Paenibacillus doosanensis]